MHLNKYKCANDAVFNTKINRYGPQWPDFYCGQALLL